MSEHDLLARWRRAEDAIGDARAVDDAAASLPPRLAAIVQAMEVLDGGDPALVASLASALAADHPDIAATLTLLLTPAIEVDIEALGAVEGTRELPYGDLLKALHVARTGRPAVATTARLALDAGYRPVLHAAYRLLSDDQTATFTNPLVHAFSPRADQLQVAARAVQITGHTARTRTAHHTTPAPAPAPAP